MLGQQGITITLHALSRSLKCTFLLFHSRGALHVLSPATVIGIPVPPSRGNRHEAHTRLLQGTGRAQNSSVVIFGIESVTCAILPFPNFYL
eukprot:1401320-Rhodomonas_salina.2